MKVKRAEHEIIRSTVIKTPAVDLARFERVQRIIDVVRYHHHEARARDVVCNLAVGIARCGYCGGRLLCSSGKAKGRIRHPYYHCRSNYYLYKAQYGGGCKQPNMRQPDVDSLLEKFATHTLSDPDVLTSLIVDSIQRTGEIIRPFPTKSKISGLEQRERRLLDALEQGVISVDEFRERRTKIRTQKAALATLQPDTNSEQQMELQDFVTAVVRGAVVLRRLADQHEKKAIIQRLFSEVFFKEDYVITSFRFRNSLPARRATLGDPIIDLPKPFRLYPFELPIPDGCRRCSACRQVISIKEFYPRRGQCKTCVSEIAHRAHRTRKAKAAARREEAIRENTLFL